MNWLLVLFSKRFRTDQYTHRMRAHGLKKMNALIIAFVAIIGSTALVDAQYQPPRKLVCVYNSTSFNREGQNNITEFIYFHLNRFSLFSFGFSLFVHFKIDKFDQMRKQYFLYE